MSNHARLSPSSAERWMNCPGSVRECAKYPEGESSPAAIDGTHTHTLLEHCIKGAMANPLSLVGIKLSDHEGEFIVDKDRAVRVKTALDYIDKRAKEMGEIDVVPEHKVNCGLMIDRDDMRGTLDVQLLSDDCLEIIDYKDGMGIVEPKNNKQLSLYALGVLAMKRSAVGWNFEKVILTIIQPKLVVKGLDAVRSWETTVTELLEFQKEVEVAAKRTDDENAPLIAGEDQCKWCSHKGSCHEYYTKTLSQSGISFDDLSMKASNKEPTELSDEEIAEIVKSAPTIRALIEAVEEEALRRIKSGKEVEGLKVIKTSGRRKWAYDDDEMAEKLKRMQVPKSAMFVTKLVSPTQIKNLTWEKKDGTVKSLSDRQLRTLENEYVVKSEGGLKVVPESAKGEAVVFNVSEMFNNVQDDIPDFLK